MFILHIGPARAGVNLPWSTTFNCYDWSQGQSLSCDGLTPGGAYTACGKGTSITSAANNPNGGGGKGARYWDGNGSNVQSGPLNVEFNAPQKELWIRWYMRYQQGYKWNPMTYDKHLYIRTGTSGLDAIAEFAWADTYQIYAQSAGGAYANNNAGWLSTMGGSSSDGKWHCYEIHIKMDTTSQNGVAEMWLDGVKKFSYTNVNFSNGNATARQGWTWLALNSNQSTPANGTCMYVDFDDIAIRTTGPIGLVNGSGGQQDTTAPTTPTNLRATAASSSQINLTWTASTDNVGVTGYRIYRNGTQIATTSATSYQNTALSPRTAYTYTVSAYDAAGNNSPQSSSVSATTPAASDTQAPVAPTGVTARVVSSSQINLSWNASSDNVGVAGYRVYRNSSQIATVSGTSYSDTGLSASTTYSYRVAAYDAAGNTSSQSAAVSATTSGNPAPTDGTAPSVPANLKATVASSSQINLSWSASTDNVGVAGYRVYRNGTQIASTAATTYQNTGLSAGTTYTYTVSAYDGAGNRSSQSSPVSATTTQTSSAKLLFEERFEDANFSARGWYDNTYLTLSSVEHIAGSTKSAEFHYAKGATTPTSGGSMRRTFPETDTLYISYYVKYSSNWTGSNKPYHPHEFLVLSNKDGDWDGPAFNYLTTYIEQNEGEPLVSIQDGKNIDKSRIGADLTRITEYRGVAGCNGDSDGTGNGSCYAAGSDYWNGKQWRSGNVYFRDTTGTYYKNNWHFMEVYIKLNSVVNGKGVADGSVTYWYDGNIIMDKKNLMMRTGAHADMKFHQFMIAPYIGDGSPIDQTFWIDNLKVATGR